MEKGLKMTKDKGGRPTVMTKEMIGKLESAFLMGYTDREASCYANINPSTLYDYCTLHPEFSERKEMLKDKPVMKAKTIIDDSLDDGDISTAKYVLDQKEGRKIDVTSGGKPMATVINFISPDE